MANFSSENKGTWFFFDELDESLGGVCLRLMSPDEEDRIERLTVKKKQKPSRGVMMEVKTVDSKMKDRLTYDAWITDWKNVELNNKPVSCTTENKVAMMRVTDFARFVVDNILNLSETNKTIEEAKAKNLESSSGGKKQKSLANDV